MTCQLFRGRIQSSRNKPPFISCASIRRIIYKSGENLILEQVAIKKFLFFHCVTLMRVTRIFCWNSNASDNNERELSIILIDRWCEIRQTWWWTLLAIKKKVIKIRFLPAFFINLSNLTFLFFFFFLLYWHVRSGWRKITSFHKPQLVAGSDVVL